MKYSNKELSLIGSSLYLCEGARARVSKRSNGQKQNIFAIEFTNMDTRVIKLFLEFLRKVLKADENKIKAELFIYPDHDDFKLKNYWIKQTRIPLSRFNKTIKLKQKNIKYKPNPLGILKIRYSHKEHFLKMQGIIKKIFGPEVDF
jgi:hypothetical protein